MAERLPVPPELEHLVEKRDQEEDRRQRQRRGDSDQRQDDLGPLGAIESTGRLEDIPLGERRTGEERRDKKGRRHQRRRESDA